MLTLPDVLRWLQTLGVWPADMPTTDDVDALRLTPNDLDRQKAEERQQRAERERQWRTVNIDDKLFDLDDGFTLLRAALDIRWTEHPRSWPLHAGLQTSRKPTPGPAPATGSPVTASAAVGSRPSCQACKSWGGGFAGEWFAYRWLERQYGTDFSLECWASGYRERVFPGIGDDPLAGTLKSPAGAAPGATRSRHPCQGRSNRAGPDSSHRGAGERPEPAVVATSDHQRHE
ncbi:hypothetical protein [Micromonospora globbae]|uniref:hypothetical protein n=1 Tax=Micromonospora globbae TaxID=1894969 RepID=UPI00386EF463|nr:hypothetical protein OH732_04905 [Micromonospora globbae]